MISRYRALTEREIDVLEANGCRAEEWATVTVAEGFDARRVLRTDFYGTVEIGAQAETVEVSKGFVKHSGIVNATLRNVRVGDNCLVENVGNYINNYTIGDGCHISNVCTMETTEGATYGEGNVIAVLNEVGEGNVMLYGGLGSQMAALMVRYSSDKPFRDAIRRMVNEEVRRTRCDRGTIGNRVKIVNTREVTNTVVADDCEIDGAARLSDCTLLGMIRNQGKTDWAVALKDSDEYIGECMLLKVVDGYLGEIGWYFRRSFWGQGYAREAAEAVIAYSRDTLGVMRLCAQIDERNERSKRLTERLGFTLEAHLPEADFGGRVADVAGQEEAVIVALPYSRTVFLVAFFLLNRTVFQTDGLVLVGIYLHLLAGVVCHVENKQIINRSFHFSGHLVTVAFQCRTGLRYGVDNPKFFYSTFVGYIYGKVF